MSKSIEYELGQMEAWSRVLTYLNTLDTILVDKKQIYKTVSSFEPCKRKRYINADED